MCEAMVLTFDEGAVFVAARDVTPANVARIERAAQFVTGNTVAPKPAEGALFRQITDSIGLELFTTYAGLSVGEPVECTPEELVASGFPEQAVINGLAAARVLSRS